MNITCILVSHDPADILSWADSILLMKDGEIVQQGTPEEVYRQPVNEYCAGLLGEYNIISGELLQMDVPAGKKWMVRPESFQVSDENDHLISAVVQRLSFFGSYYTAEVSAGGDLIKIKITGKTIRPGDRVFLSVNADDTWSI